jgi:hypothetical protein
MSLNIVCNITRVSIVLIFCSFPSYTMPCCVDFSYHEMAYIQTADRRDGQYLICQYLRSKAVQTARDSHLAGRWDGYYDSHLAGRWDGY